VSARELDAGLEELLEFLHRSRGSDFTGCDRGTLERRVQRRMEVVGVAGYADYLDYLEVEPNELAPLLDALLVEVTAFFRDPPAWARLQERVLPELLAQRGEDEPIRVWCAGCATGQEAFTVAIVLAELLGPERHRERVKIYATDIDEEALATARLATYTQQETESLPGGLRERYFERVDSHFAFRPDLRRTVIFGRNDLVEDAPISRLDLLLCRNTLVFFTVETQSHLLRRFHVALRPDAVLMLGRAETLVAQHELFAPLDPRLRLFRRRGRAGTLRLAPADPGARAAAPVGDAAGLRAAAFDATPVPLLLVSRAGALVAANAPARQLFGLGPEHLGRAFGELALAHGPATVGAVLDGVLRDRRPASAGQVRSSPPGGEERRLDVTVTPLTGDDDTPLGAVVAYEDVTRVERLRDELAGHRRDLELAYEELHSTIDELEATNEALRSTDEELAAVADELRDRAGELDRVSERFESVLSSLALGVAVLDPGRRIQVWNRRAEDLWGVRGEEAVGQDFLGLDIGLPVAHLAAALRAVLGGTQPREEIALQAVDRRGRTIRCATTVVPLRADATDGRPDGAIVLMEERP